jgi:Sec-independent protein translocase protein TatA
MFDISSGEILVVGAVGIALTGKRDLPAACRFVGSQVGRVVGLLQGARAKADQFAHQHELKQLQNEFRSGLRELDQVKMELALAASTRGMIGRNLGATTASSHRIKNVQTQRNLANNVVWEPSPSNSAPSQNVPFYSESSTSIGTVSSMPLENSAPMPTLVSSNSNNPIGVKTSTGTSRLSQNTDLFDYQVVDDGYDKQAFEAQATTASTAAQDRTEGVTNMERAVMEEEWLKQGIGFRAMAEQGEWNSGGGGTWDTRRATGSELLEYLERQCLIFDQYDQAVAEKDQALQQRMTRLKQQEQEKSSNGDQSKSS